MFSTGGNNVLGRRGEEVEELLGETSGVIGNGKGGRSVGLNNGDFNCGRFRCLCLWKEGSENNWDCSEEESLCIRFESSSLMALRDGPPAGD